MFGLGSLCWQAALSCSFPWVRWNSKKEKLSIPGCVVDTAVSNFDIFNWMKCFRINNYNGVLTRDQIKNQFKTGYYVINLDNHIVTGTHWVAMNIKLDVIEYFDGFGLNCQIEVIQWSDNLRLYYLHNSTQYQNLRGVLWECYRLYYINK